MRDYPDLRVEIDDAVAVLTFDRPEKLNSLRIDTVDNLVEVLEEIEGTSEIRAVVLRGAEEAFSAGYDLSSTEADEVGMSMSEGLGAMGSYDHLQTIYELDVPVVAAVDGYALGGGCNTAIICDLTIVSERAQLGYPDVRMGGLPTALIHPFVTNSIKHARELFYSGKMVDGSEAARMGLANRAVPHDELMDTVRDEIENIRKTPKPIVTITKQLLNDVMESQGYRPANKRPQYLATLTILSDYAQEFYEIRNEEGLESAIDWMNSISEP